MPKFTALLLAVWLVPCAAFAGVTEVIKAVEAKYADVSAMQASFVQTTKSDLYGAEELHGELTVKRPKMMRWQFKADGKQFLTDGSTMWVYTPADKQVIRYEDVSSSSSGADALLQSLDKLSELFDVKLVSEDATAKVLMLGPKGENQPFKSIQLTLDGDLVVKKVVITDSFDSVTELAFQAVKLNAIVDDAVFRFTVPDGVEVISAGM